VKDKAHVLFITFQILKLKSFFMYQYILK